MQDKTIIKRRKDGIRQRYHVRPRWHFTAKNIKEKFRMIPVDDIEPVEINQDKDHIEEIAKSGDIREPIHVHGKYNPAQKYQLFNGHHRWFAAKKRGDKLIPAIIHLNETAHELWRKRQASVKESQFEKERRLRAGYTQLAMVDAQKLKTSWEKNNEEQFAWNPIRLKNKMKRGFISDAYPRVFFSSGHLDIEDGRHRIAAAAEKGQKIIIAFHEDFPQDIIATLK
jgi:hypothetical protein